MSSESPPASLRSLPKIDTLLRLPGIEDLAARHGRERVLELLRTLVEQQRRKILQDGARGETIQDWSGRLPGRMAEVLQRELESSLRPVINATGVLVHTNLGRSPLSPEALSRIAQVAGVYSTLEYDLAQGARGSRSVHAQRLFSRLFPGHAAHVVNNNAAAVLLALNTLAEGKEVIVSRGELVEIGGSFRIPDVMRKGQALLREVGTTNRTRLADYEAAIHAATGLLLKVHTSNYRIVGFTAQASLAELVELGRRRGIPVMVDQGSGNLLDLSQQGIGDEPPVSTLLEQGADLVTFSGDKLLGGPQCGVLAGRADLIERVRKNPLSRALRVDKMTYAALEATLESYVRGQARDELPVLRMILESAEGVAQRARRCAGMIHELSGGRIETQIIPGSSLVGGGAAPLEQVPTQLLAVTCAGVSPASLESALRSGNPPVIARIEADRLVLDLRTVLPGQEEALAGALASLAAPPTR
jgi:L-seryl-tRNA(Ser) seleniumtransferase